VASVAIVSVSISDGVTVVAVVEIPLFLVSTSSWLLFLVDLTVDRLGCQGTSLNSFRIWIALLHLLYTFYIFCQVDNNQKIL